MSLITGINGGVGVNPLLGNLQKTQVRGRLITSTRNGTQSMFSDNGGVTWKAGGAVTNLGWYGHAYDQKNRRMAAIANASNNAMYTNDGVLWTMSKQPPATDTSYFKVKYDSFRGRLIACSQGNHAAWSDNGGVTWTTVSMSPVTSASWFPIGFDPSHNRMIITGGDTSAYSPDGGSTWVQGGAFTGALVGAGWNEIAYDSVSNRVVIVGSGASNNGTVTAWSSDGGATWVQGGSLPTAASWVTLAYDPIRAKLVAMSNNSGTVGISADGGTSWTSGSIGTTATWRGMTFDPVHQRLVVTDAVSAQAAYSNDGGSTWVVVTSTPNSGGAGLAVIS